MSFKVTDEFFFASCCLAITLDVPNLLCIHYAVFPSMSARMSDTLQAVIRRPSLIGFGKRPDLTPDHHVDRETGMIAGVTLLPMI